MHIFVILPNIQFLPAISLNAKTLVHYLHALFVSIYACKISLIFIFILFLIDKWYCSLTTYEVAIKYDLFFHYFKNVKLSKFLYKHKLNNLSPNPSPTLYICKSSDYNI